MATDYAGALAVLESSSLDGFQTICVCAHTDARFELHAMQMQKPVPMATVCVDDLPAAPCRNYLGAML